MKELIVILTMVSIGLIADAQDFVSPEMKKLITERGFEIPSEKKIVPYLRLYNVNTDLTEEIKSQSGEVYVIHNWAPHCAPCIPELPYIDSLYTLGSEMGFKVLVLTTSGSLEVNNFLAKHNFKLPFYRDRWGYEYDFRTTHVIPFTYIVDKKGIVVAEYLGDRNDSTSERMKILYKALLNEK
jgi:thiol-disulfide isomerase/thioredoxin